ncbi:hypothetical protein [Asticcacaulis sp. AND118]|uniref:hypothetical protein n=1 Tax=Asticcacaulis sp. AND118 TaxID=2840468 RepID=UPI001CFF9098|nr:hypothetical protein [Asticcacaulis sp. AND118]UDF05349.1 hypothetical protein LH365_14160 [Asticcacaulis sp. AND118]
MADNEGKVSVGLVSGEQNNKDGQQPDLATAVATAIFEGRSLSDRFALRASIEANAALNQPGAENLILSKSGPNATLVAEEKEKDDREKLSDMAVSYSALTQEQAEWSRTKHEYFGVALTGAEWGELGMRLQTDKRMQDWLVNRLMKDGDSREEAVRKAKELADLATILSKPENQRTKEEQAKVDAALKDPQFNKIMPELNEQRIAGNQKLDAEKPLHMEQTQSVGDGAEIFASAPNMTAHHAKANAATVPLDNPEKRPAPAPLAAPDLSLLG